MEKNRYLAGVFSPIIALGGVGAAIILNRSWWRITENAISDLGKVGLPHNWVMNSAFVIASALGIYYALGSLRELKNFVQKLGVGIFGAGLLFLALIGIFPEGTSPHYYVSWAFFITASLGMLITGIGFYVEEDRKFGAFTVILFLIAWFLSMEAMRTFKGVAVPEFIGAFGIATWHYTLLARLKG